MADSVCSDELSYAHCYVPNVMNILTNGNCFIDVLGIAMHEGQILTMLRTYFDPVSGSQSNICFSVKIGVNNLFSFSIVS